MEKSVEHVHRSSGEVKPQPESGLRFLTASHRTSHNLTLHALVGQLPHRKACSLGMQVELAQLPIGLGMSVTGALACYWLAHVRRPFKRKGRSGGHLNSHEQTL